jgi:hypothetical protein
MTFTRTKRAPMYVVVAVALVTLAAMAHAGAAPTIAEPTANPFPVQLDPKGHPVPFTIAAAGFRAGSLVYVEQCDAKPPTEQDWEPTRNCDIGTSPAAAIVDPSGQARFAATDPNHALQPFVGLGPQGLFSCLAPNAPSLKNGLPEFRTCQIRVSSNNNQSTSDQVFLPIVFGNSRASAGSSNAGSSSSKSTFLVIGVGAALLAIVAVTALEIRRRRGARTG